MLKIQQELIGLKAVAEKNKKFIRTNKKVIELEDSLSWYMDEAQEMKRIVDSQVKEIGNNEKKAKN